MNRDRRIDAYIAKAQPFARQILEKASERVHAALPGAQRLIAASGEVTDLSGCFALDVQAGDMIEIETPGGGGFGPA